MMNTRITTIPKSKTDLGVWSVKTGRLINVKKILLPEAWDQI